jgi:mercuric reductase
MTDSTCSTDGTCCEEKQQHLVIIGGGSAAFAAATKASSLGAKVTLINEGLPIGGTCVNVGCIPSKAMIRAAETVFHATHSRFDGIASTGQVTDFGAITAQTRQLVSDLRQKKYIDVVSDLPDFRMIAGRASLLDQTTVSVNDEQLHADRILIATGVSTQLPPVEGLADSGYLTNETLFDLDELPESVIILGGRYIALELGQMLHRLGSKVTILQRSARIIPTETEELTDALTHFLRDEGIRIETGVNLDTVRRNGGTITVEARIQGEACNISASHLLVATGRRANTDNMGLTEVGVNLDANGHVVVQETMETNVPTIYGAGDVIGEPQFVYTAAYEGALAVENALDGTSRHRDYTALPWVMFTDPQVAGVGLDLPQALEKGFQAEARTLSLDQVPRCVAARDTRGFVTLIRDMDTDKIIGTRILAPEGSELTMEISLAIKHGMTTSELAGSFHAYLTLSEAIKLAAITFRTDVGKLSCCAV